MKFAAGGPTIAVVAGSELRTRIGSALREVGLDCQEWDSWATGNGSSPDLILSGLAAYDPDAWQLSAYQKEQARRGRRIRFILLGSQPPAMSAALEDDEPIGDTSDIPRIVARVREVVAEWRACPGTLTIDRQLIDSMLDGYALHEMIFDAEGEPCDYRFLLVNPAFERLTGLPVESVVGRRVAEVLPGTGSQWIDTYGKVVAAGEPCRFEAHHEDLDRHYEVVGFRPREGQFACLFRDITEQKRQQASVQSSEQRHRAVIQTALDGFAMFDLEGRLLDVNDEMCRLSLYAREDLLRLRMADLVARFTPQELRDHMRHVQYAGANHIETLLRRNNGQHMEVELNLCYWPVDGVFFVFLRDITEHKQRERERERTAAALEASERSYRELIERLPEGAIVHQDGRILFLNKEAARILGIARPELAVGSPLDAFWQPETRESRRERIQLLLTGAEEACRSEEQWTRADGRGIEVETSVTRAVFQGREALHEVFRDVTDRKRLEQEFLQAQKMESLGRLAGGIAHDFNNLLTVINGYSRLLLDPATAARGLPTAAGQIHQAGERAAALVRQLLVFSRRQVAEKKHINPNEIIAGTGKMLRRLLGEHIDVTTRLGSPMDCVLMDPYQLEQVIVNLAVNARDAMPEGGTFGIETGMLESDAGARIHLHIHDTGVGMDEPVLQRLFEPFFTTKEVGRGTGLGLSMVQSVILQAKGTIEVTSKPGAGTSFHIYLPASSRPRGQSAPAASTEPHRGNGTILLVEDQREVRDFLVTVLSDLGYHVLVPAAGGDPVSLCRAQAVDLLLSDVVMPGESGPELTRRVRTEFPGIRVLFMSGYLGEDHTAVNGALRDAAFLAKPFTPHALTEKIREVLSPAPGTRG